ALLARGPDCAAKLALRVDRKIRSPSVADRDARGLHQDQPKERVTLLRDLAEMVRIRGRVEGRRQADVAGDLLTAGKPADGPENHDRGEGRHWTNARLGE